MADVKNVYAKLLEVQTKLKAPKSQYNSFGKYNYRNCEDILEAVKPLLKEENLSLAISDKAINMDGWHYIEVTITLVNIDRPEEIIITSGLAREPGEKKGMDASQITGSSSSYARKYALNGLFAIDDTKDSDYSMPQNNANTAPAKAKPKAKKSELNQSEIQNLYDIAGAYGMDVDKVAKGMKHYFGKTDAKELTKKEYLALLEKIQAKVGGENE